MTIISWGQYCPECSKPMKDEGLWPQMNNGKTARLSYRFMCHDQACRDKLGHYPTKNFATEVPFIETEEVVA